MGSKASHVHARERRASESHFNSINRISTVSVSDTVHHFHVCVLIRVKCFVLSMNSPRILFRVFPATLNSFDYVLQAVINISDLDGFQAFLRTLNFTLVFNNTVEVTSINTTTGNNTTFPE